MITIIRPNNTSLRFDKVEALQIARGGVATKHPISQGARATDHYQAELPSISFTGYVTQDPIQGAAPVVAGSRRTTAAARFLEDCQGEFVSLVIPGRGVFTPCLIETFPETQGDAKLESRFDITAGEMRPITPQGVRLPNPPTPAAVVAAEAPESEDIGPQPPIASTEADREKGSPAVEGLISLGVLQPLP